MMKKVNKKVFLGMLAMVVCIAIVALCSFFPFIIDPSRWKTKEFLSDQLIASAISIFSIVCVMYMAQASNASNERSNICKARVKFLGNGANIEGSVNRILKHDKISAFSQWVKHVLQPQDIRTAKERILVKCGIEDMHILDLDDTEIKSLVGNPQKIGDRYYKSITKKQYTEVMRAKALRMQLVDPSYYLVCSKYSGDKTITEESSTEQKKKTILLTFSIGSKVIMSLVLTMIFVSLVFDTTQGGQDQATAWLKFASRMFAMLTSAFLGFNVGCQMNDIEAHYIELKCFVHDRFIEDKNFVPKTQQELAKEDFKERVKEETILRIGGK